MGHLAETQFNLAKILNELLLSYFTSHVLFDGDPTNYDSVLEWRLASVNMGRMGIWHHWFILCSLQKVNQCFFPFLRVCFWGFNFMCPCAWVWKDWDKPFLASTYYFTYRKATSQQVQICPRRLRATWFLDTMGNDFCPFTFLGSHSIWVGTCMWRAACWIHC